MNEIKQLNIKDGEAYDLASEIAGLRGGTLTAAVLSALRREAEVARKEQTREARIKALLDLGRRYSELRDRDTRTPDEIIGYDENGLPK
jgi:antitoxin VapB